MIRRKRKYVAQNGMQGLGMLIVTWLITGESDPVSSVNGQIIINFRMNKMTYFTVLKVKCIILTFSLSLSFKNCILKHSQFHFFPILGVN